VLPFPRLDVLRQEQEVRVGGRLGAEVEHHRRGDQALDRHLGDIGAVPTGDPVYGRIEVGAGVLTG
jgi:hypothetical protein